MESFPQITLWITAIFALISVPMSVAVGLRRARTGISLLHGNDDDLLRRMRAHGNFIEYVPIALMALAAAEVSGGPSWFVLVCGLVLIAARLIHYFGLRAAQDSKGRLVGAALTTVTISALGVATLWHLIRAL